MVRIFRPRSTTLFRVILIGTPLLLLLILGVSVVIKTSPYSTDETLIQDQPIPFSHKHHVTGLGLDCRYCHTTVETAAFAGMPSTHTCMTCHSQIWTNAKILEPLRQSQRTGIPIAWNRVYRLPHFVYFTHAPHIARKIECQTCHGPIQLMPMTWKARSFTMRDCLSCHEPEEKKLAGQVQANQQRPTGRLTSCNTCHR